MNDTATSSWKPIESFDEPDRQSVDLWMYIYASPRSMGMSDAFRVMDAFREDGKWFHWDGGKKKELHGEYVKFWMPIPEPPPAPSVKQW